jgi:hypothetical protein
MIRATNKENDPFVFMQPSSSIGRVSALRAFAEM